MRYLNLTLLFTILTLVSCSKDESFEHDNSLDLKENLQNIGNHYVEKGIPGIVLLVDSPTLGTNIIESGYSNLETETQITKSHLFHSASLMKTYTATCIFMLDDNNLLDISDKIETHLPLNIIEKIPNGNLATIESILNHSSGIPDFAEQDSYLEDLFAFTEGGNEPQDFLEYIKSVDPDFIVGSDHHYSNSGYYILSLIIEEISGQSFELFLQDNIIEKLDLKNTFYRNLPTEVDYTKVPEYYIDWDDNGELTNSTKLENNATLTFKGFSGMLATIEDYHKFIKALLSEKILISETSLEKMKTITHSENFGYGKGLEVILSDKHPNKYGHKGGTQASFFYYPDEDLFLLSMINYSFNTGNSPFDELAIVRNEIGVNDNLLGEIELCIFE